MTTEHILYIPMIFLIGFVVGRLSSRSNVSEVHSVASENDLKTKSISGRLVIGAFVIFALVFVATHLFELPDSAKAVTKSLGGLEMFDRKPSFSSSEVYSRISSFPDEGIQSYKRFTYTVDIVFPITFLTFLFLLSRFVTRKRKIHKALVKVVNVLPVIWFAADMLENGIIFFLLNELPGRYDFLAGCLGIITVTKFLFLLLSLLGPAFIMIGTKGTLQTQPD